MLPNMFLAYIRLIFRGYFVEITTAILLVHKILKKPLDVFGYWYLYRSWKKNLFTSKLDLNLRKKLVKCYFWSIALYGAETWTLRKIDQKYLESFKCGAGEEWRSVGPIV
jgi:hypothetical protein